MTTSTTRWSSASGTPDPVHRPADPFATIPGAYHEDPFCACPDGMPCVCVADSTDPSDDRDY